MKYDGQAIQVLHTSYMAILKWRVVYVERSMKIGLEEESTTDLKDRAC